MPGLILGIDLCDDYCQISCFDPQVLDAEQVSFARDDENCLIPTVLCKRKKLDQWHIGEEAYSHALCGQGTVVDKLVRLVGKNGKATIEGVTYSAAQLLQQYIRKLLDIPMKKYGTNEIERIVFTLQDENIEVMDALIQIGDSLGLPRERIHVATHSESYLYYVISQQKEIWANQTSLFNLTENGLHYYELRTVRGRTPNVVEVSHEMLEEGFSLDILDTESGRKLADRILRSCAERLLGRKIVTTVFLTGRGFEDTGWATESLQYICNRRRVFAGQGLFSKGAAFLAYDYGLEKSAYPYIGICDGRLRSTISMNVLHGGRLRQLIIAAAGSNWYGAKANVELIPDRADSLELMVTGLNGERRMISIPLHELPARPNKMTRLEVVVSFSQSNLMTVRVFDRGFGDFYPATDKMIRKEIML